MVRFHADAAPTLGRVLPSRPHPGSVRFRGDGPVDAIAGPQTARGVRVFQRRAGIRVTGIAGIRTRRALGRLGRPLYGRRQIHRGMVGWDVSVLQFMLSRRGSPTGIVDGYFGPETQRALHPRSQPQE